MRRTHSFSAFFVVSIFIFALCSGTLLAQHNTSELPTSINENGIAPHVSAMLDVNSTGKGVLIPRMTTTEREAINTPADGLLTYDTDTDSFWYFDGNEWINIGNANNQLDLSNGITVSDPCEPIIALSAANTTLSPDQGSIYNTIANQTFTHDLGNVSPSNDSLYSVQVYFGGSGPIDVDGLFDGIQNGTLRILDGGANGVIIHSQAIVIPDIEVWHEVILNTPVAVFQGQQYTIQLEETNGAFTWLKSVDFDNEDYAYQVYAFSCQNPYFVTPQTSNNTVSLFNVDTINFSNGEIFNGIGKALADDDRDTKIEVEQNQDQDEIVFSQGNVGEVLRITDGRFELPGGTNLFLGREAGENIGSKPGKYLIGIGDQALVGIDASTLSTADIAIGNAALQSYNGNVAFAANVAIGAGSLSETNTGFGNVGIGRLAGYMIGNSRITHLENSVLIGSEIRPIGSGQLSFKNVVAIGAETRFERDSTVILGNAADVGIGTTNPQAKLHVAGGDMMVDGGDINVLNGTLNINNAFSFPTNDGTNGQVLQTDGTGVVSWNTPTDNDTQLSESQVDAFVANNGYITSPDDADADPTNEIELPAGGVNGQILATDGSGNYSWTDKTVDTDTDTQLSESQVDAFVANNGYITSPDDADADPTNEIELPAGGTNGQVLQTDGVGNVSWSTPATATIISDTDNDTKIQVEENTDEDKIRFDLAGHEQYTMENSKFTMKNVGLSGNDLILEFNSNTDISGVGVLKNEIKNILPISFPYSSSNDKMRFSVTGNKTLLIVTDYPVFKLLF